MTERNEFPNKINYFDKAFIVLLESFLYKKEDYAFLWAKVIFSLLLSVNIFNLLVFVTLILGFEYSISRFHILVLVFVSMIFVFIYLKYRNQYFMDYMKQRDVKYQKKSFYISIFIYLGSFGVLGLLVYIKNLFNN